MQAEKEMLIFRLQANAIGSPNTIIPIIFSGTGEEVNDFVNRYDIKIITMQRIGANQIAGVITILPVVTFQNGDLKHLTKGKPTSLMLSNCVECGHLLDEAEYLYKGKSYCDYCYRAVKKIEGAQHEKRI